MAQYSITKGMSMQSNILFLDIETDKDGKKIFDMGAIFCHQQEHGKEIVVLNQWLKQARYLCGHNFLQHDYQFLEKKIVAAGKNRSDVIDTLYLSALLFPARPYHALNKDYKTQFAESNNPLSDCKITQELLDSEIQAFATLPVEMQTLFYGLLHQTDGFAAFFRAINFHAMPEKLESLIQDYFAQKICHHAQLSNFIRHYATELAYVLSLIHCDHRYSITPPWLLHQYPKISLIYNKLCNTPCKKSCDYCREFLDVNKGLKRYFNYDQFRQYEGKHLQQEAAQAAIKQQSFLAIFPTGGGKSITFQVPALMQGESCKALTLVISPLQSLMKDQVDNLEQLGITEAVTINGLLDPIGRQKAIERVIDGSTSLLYIAPESLRSRTIESILLGRHIARVVIDEAHCFSAWGQDFRVDYQYIGEFIRLLRDKKQQAIPVSCFTATAKPQVIEDIVQYFQKELGIELKLFQAGVARHNLSYQMIWHDKEEQKYASLRQLIDAENCPTIVYVSRVERTKELSKRLCQDGFIALPYHGKMDKEDKIAYQNQFIQGEVKIIVATSAFGMGVDKKDVGLVVHYDISDSLENYVQEAGRAGRDMHIQAKCVVLFHPDDLDKHFILLNQTKLSINEVKQIWKALKTLTSTRRTIAESPLMIARQAGWQDIREQEIEQRVKTAIAALEEIGYIKRRQNIPRVYGNSIVSPNAEHAINQIYESQHIHHDDKPLAVRVIKKLFSQRSHIRTTEEEAESRVDYLADVLGLSMQKVLQIISALRQENILADQTDLQAYIRNTHRSHDVLAKLREWFVLEEYLLEIMDHDEDWANGTIKQLNEAICYQNKEIDSTPKKIQMILNFWRIKNWAERSEHIIADGVNIRLKHPISEIQKWLKKRNQHAQFIINHLYLLAREQATETVQKNEQKGIYVEFSLVQLQQAYDQAISINDLEDALFYLLCMECLKIEGGFLVFYQCLSIERLQMDNHKQYTKEHYKKLSNYYDRRREQIHIVGKYAQLMRENLSLAEQMVKDYFSLEYNTFLSQYFTEEAQLAMKRNMTAMRFEALFGGLSPTQLQIVQDDSKYAVVLAGPGSGKTRVLVHKLASLYQLEDVKHEQLLMLTFSRAAVQEFKKRLIALIGDAAAFVEIKTFHSYCFDLLGRVGNIDDKTIIQTVAEKINSGEIEANRIAKQVLVLDEAQDINENSYHLIQALMTQNEEMRVIMVGDDDQTINQFCGSSHQYMREFLEREGAKQYELLENYRSGSHIVDFCNRFVSHIPQRLKNQDTIAHKTDTGTVEYIDYSGDVLPLLLEKVRQALNGQQSVAILVQDNQEAIRLHGVLNQANIHSKLVQDNQDFLIKNLLEMAIFQHYLKPLEKAAHWCKDENGQQLIDADAWEAAKQNTCNYLLRSVHLPLLNNILNLFEAEQTGKRYYSDWESFICETFLKDVYLSEQQCVMISTIHKAKGREYDHVFVLLDREHMHHSSLTEEKLRVLYVGFSRAKAHLTVLSNHPEVCRLCAPEYIENYTGQNKLLDQRVVLYLCLEDIYLSKSGDFQDAIKTLNSGDGLQIDNYGCKNQQGQYVLWFSKEFKKSHDPSKLTLWLNKGYRLSSAEVNFIVLWQGKKEKQENKILRIVLPIVYLER